MCWSVVNISAYVMCIALADISRGGGWRCKHFKYENRMTRFFLQQLSSCLISKKYTRNNFSFSAYSVDPIYDILPYNGFMYYAQWWNYLVGCQRWSHKRALRNSSVILVNINDGIELQRKQKCWSVRRRKRWSTTLVSITARRNRQTESPKRFVQTTHHY